MCLYSTFSIRLSNYISILGRSISKIVLCGNLDGACTMIYNDISTGSSDARSETCGVVKLQGKRAGG